MGMTEIGLAEAVEVFLEVECAGKSAATREHYGVMLRGLVAGVGDKALGEIQEFEVLAWAAGVMKSKKKAYTQVNYLLAAKIFFRWSQKAGMANANLGKNIKLPRLAKGKRAGVAEADADQILEAAKSKARDHALILFMATTGCRRGGAAGLRLEDIDLEKRQAWLREKGEKERCVFFTEECAQALGRWMEKRDAGLGDSVFGMTARAISEMLRRYQRRLGISGPVSPHQWRHRFAKRAIEAGMDISQVSQLLGHENIHITAAYYLQFGLDRLQKAYDLAFK